MKIVDGVAYIYGIVSFGRGCGRIGNPGVYVKVSKYVDWIQETIKNWLTKMKYLWKFNFKNEFKVLKKCIENNIEISL